MNICIVSTYSCTFEDFTAVVDEYEESFKEFITEFELVKVNDHKSIIMCHCTDMEAFEAMMTSPEMKEWDKENNCVDIVYSLEKINQPPNFIYIGERLISPFLLLKHKKSYRGYIFC